MDFIFEVGQTVSLFLAIIFMEGVLSAKTKTIWPGLLFACVMLAISIAVGVIFQSRDYFFYMMVPTLLCFLAFFISRRNIAKGDIIKDDFDDEP